MDSSLAIYVVAALALIVTPGQDMLYVISRSLAQGRRAGVLSAIGVCLGILVHTALAAGTLASRLAHGPAAAWLDRAGGTVLVLLGLRLAASGR